MSDAGILKSLREQVLDETQSLPGLLRKCLALGAVTGSEDLRAWATNELKGYDGDSSLPAYRSITAPLFIDTLSATGSGALHRQGQQINHLQIPSKLRQYVPESLDFRQSVEELVQMAEASKDESHKIGYAVFSLVMSRWNAQMPMGQELTGMYYGVGPSSLAGIVGAVRTTLLEMVIDMTKDVPLDTLPSRAKVDSVVKVHVGNNEVNITGNNSGIIGQGAGSTQIQNSSVPTELVDVIGKLRAALSQVVDAEQRADAEQAIADFEASVSEDDPKPEKVKRRWAMLERVGTALGTAVLTEAVKEGAPAVVDYLQLMM